MNQEQVDKLNQAYHALTSAEIKLAEVRESMEKALIEWVHAREDVAYSFSIVHPEAAKEIYSPKS
jgi:hypothetical protein